MTFRVNINFSFKFLCIPLISKSTDQRLLFHVCATLFLLGHFDYLDLSGPLSSICTAFPNAIRLCWVCFGGRALLVLRLSRNSTECWEFRTGWQARTTIPTLPADFIQGLSIHPLWNRVKALSLKLISHCEIQLHEGHSRGGSSNSVALSCNPDETQASQIFVEGIPMFSNAIFLSPSTKYQ